MVILGGDLNMHPQDLGNRLLRTYTGLKDSYLETEKFDVRVLNFILMICLQKHNNGRKSSVSFLLVASESANCNALSICIIVATYRDK